MLLDAVERAQADAQVVHRVAGVEQQMIFDYLLAEGLEYVTDPATGEAFSVYQWVQSRMRVGSASVYAEVIQEFAELDSKNPMNYERSYLAALMGANPLQVILARQKFQSDLIEYFGDDPVGTYEYLQRIDVFGPE